MTCGRVITSQSYLSLNYLTLSAVHTSAVGRSHARLRLTAHVMFGQTVLESTVLTDVQVRLSTQCTILKPHPQALKALASFEMTAVCVLAGDDRRRCSTSESKQFSSLLHGPWGSAPQDSRSQVSLIFNSPELVFSIEYLVAFRHFYSFQEVQQHVVWSFHPAGQFSIPGA